MTDDELLALAQIGVGIAANEVAALIERHRAEIERLTRERDEAERKLSEVEDQKIGEAYFKHIGAALARKP